MSLRQRLKNRLFSLPEEIAAGVKQFSYQSTSSSVTSGLASLAAGVSGGSPRYQPPKVNLEMGAELLEHYQDQWEALHRANEQNANLASNCDRLITELHDKYERQWNEVSTLQMLVSQIPRINEQVEEIMRSLGDLEAGFSDVEVALLALEDTIDARELQEKQLDQRFQVAMYQEKRKAEYNQLANRLKLDYETKKHERERTSILAQKDVQMNFHKKFQEDMAKFSTDQQLKVPSSSSRRPHHPHQHDPDASLETVDLNEDDSSLENFLDDLSPLPADDEDVNGAEDDNRKEGENSTMPRDESMYYTPDSTAEALSDLLLKQNKPD